MEAIFYREELLEDAIYLSKTGQDFINEHGLESYVYKNYPDIIPLELKAGYKKKWQKQWIQNELLVEEWNAVRRKLGEKRIRPIALKGMALMPEFYQDLGSRRMCDVDFLIDQEELQVTTEVLLEQGFKELEADKWHANNFKYLFSKTISGVELVLEIHTRLFYHSNIRIIETMPYQWGERLSLELQFIHLTGHLAFQHTFSHFYWMIDVWNFYRTHNHEMRWSLILKEARELKLFRSIQMCLWVISEVFEENLSEEQNIMFELDGAKFWKLGLSTDFLLRPRRMFLRYLWVKFNTKDSLAESFHYFGGWLKNFLFGRHQV